MTTETAAPLPSATVKPLRSRIDGLLHRHMPATLTVREIADRAVADQRLYLTLSVSSETPYLRNDGWEDPWVEVLGHKPDEVDLSRLNGGAPILANHDRFTATGDTPLAGIGAADRAWLDGGRVYADITVSARAATTSKGKVSSLEMRMQGFPFSCRLPHSYMTLGLSPVRSTIQRSDFCMRSIISVVIVSVIPRM